MASRTEDSEEIDKWELKQIETQWFLDIGGKLKRLAILDKAQNVRIVNNVIFAGDKLYQIFTSDNSEIVVSEIEDIRATTNTAEKIKGKIPISGIDISDNGKSSASVENAPNNAGTNDESGTVVEEPEDVCGNTNYDTETSLNRSDNGKSLGSAEDVPINAFSSVDNSNLYASVTKKSKRDDESSSDSEAYYNLERGSEQYVDQKKKGLLRGILKRLKKAVKGKQKAPCKKKDARYEDIFDVREKLLSNFDSEIKDEVSSVDISSNIDEVPGSTLVSALYDFEAFLDDEISFKKYDRFKLYEEGYSSNSEWCLVKHFGTGKKGYIPRAYVTKDLSSLEFMEWWFDVDRFASEQLLLLSGFSSGTFLVRPSDMLSSLGTPMYVLSMLYRNSERLLVAHYRIKQHMGRVFIFPNRKFNRISELIEFYRGEQHLKCYLKGTVRKHSPIVYPRQMEVGRESLGQMAPFECGKFRLLFAGKFFHYQDVTVAQLATREMTSEEIREAAAVLYNIRDCKAQIVRMLAVCFELKFTLIVLGETIYCTLKEYLETRRESEFFIRPLLQFAAQVADGMAFLERNNVVHRYLRADCVFVCYPYEAKIAHPRLNQLLFGTVANENVQGVKEKEALSHLERGTRLQSPYDSPDRCPPAFYVTMLKCWHTHPDCRPTFEFLRELFLDFDNIGLSDIGSKELTACRKFAANVTEVFEQQTTQESGGRQSDSQPTNRESTERNVTTKTSEPATTESEDEQVGRGFCVKVAYSFEADEDGEISLNIDDVITHVVPIDEGWWMGTTTDGIRGIFPSNYVKVIEGKESDSTYLNLNSIERNFTSEILWNPEEKTQDLPISRGFSVKVLYDYVAEQDDEISMCKDDIITDIDPVQKNWWEGTAPDGKRGMFPSNFVEVFEGCYAEVTKL